VRVAYFPEAEAELNALSIRERSALLAAIEKLQSFGDRLPYPHTSAVQGARATLRELRPRAGRSQWRAFYRRVGNVIVIGAIGPEARANPKGFQRAVEAALERLADTHRLLTEIL
jgi:hypothetical protein